MAPAGDALNNSDAMKYALILLVGIAGLTGCRTKNPDVMTTYHPVSGVRTDLMSENELVSSQNPPREIIWLNGSRVFKDMWNRKYAIYLEAMYQAREDTGLLDVPFGQTLTLVVDGKEMRLAGNGSYNRRGNAPQGTVLETSLYEVTMEQLDQIANAKTVKMRLKGNNGLVEREFGPENFQRFQEFVSRLRTRSTY